MKSIDEQIQNIRSAHLALLEVSTALPKDARVHTRVDGEHPELEVQLLKMTHAQAVEVATSLGFYADGDIRKTRHNGNAIIHSWLGQVADFPVLLTRYEHGAPIPRRPNPGANRRTNR